MVGVLVGIAQGRLPLTVLDDLFANPAAYYRERKLSLPTAEPHGLYLVAVHYRPQGIQYTYLYMVLFYSIKLRIEYSSLSELLIFFSQFSICQGLIVLCCA